MTILEWIVAILFVAILSLMALLMTVGIVFVLIGLFAKGYDTTREQIIHERYKK